MAYPAPGEFKDVVLFLATAGIVVPVFRRWKVSPILGFLVAGVVLGPSGLGALASHSPGRRKSRSIRRRTSDSSGNSASSS